VTASRYAHRSLGRYNINEPTLSCAGHFARKGRAPDYRMAVTLVASVAMPRSGSFATAAFKDASHRCA
jgi:hypothetical protein